MNSLAAVFIDEMPSLFNAINHDVQIDVRLRWIRAMNTLVEVRTQYELIETKR